MGSLFKADIVSIRQSNVELVSVYVLACLYWYLSRVYFGQILLSR